MEQELVEMNENINEWLEIDSQDTEYNNRMSGVRKEGTVVKQHLQGRYDKDMIYYKQIGKIDSEVWLYLYVSLFVVVTYFNIYGSWQPWVGELDQVGIAEIMIYFCGYGHSVY